ncbi:PaaI family thioesterase [Vaginella massiliensis]|uniref:PaaI family thioesterase n=1 Tax=Vaginella massiliensis TaxID=1816680 RepID=UPI003752BAF7
MAANLKELFQQMSENTLISHLQIEYVEVTPEYVIAKMPVQAIVRQPFGLLHGGASVVLAETLGSMLSSLVIDQSQFMAVGQRIDAHHLRAKRDGEVIAKATFIKKGKTSHLLKIEIKDEEDRLICYCHLTCAIIPKNYV